jgi:hypothetical protein
MKKSFDELCDEILNEGGQDSTNPVGTTAKPAATETIPGGSTEKEQNTTQQTTQNQNNANANKEQTNASLKPEDVLKALTQIDPNHPELHTFMDKVSKALADKQKQVDYNKQAQTNASQTKPTA